MSTEKADRIQTLCKKLWGDHCDYDIDYETDDYLSYYTYIKEDFGDRYGKLVWANLAGMSLERAGKDLERHLERMVREKSLNQTGPDVQELAVLL
jgi:hypothetical protein